MTPGEQRTLSSVRAELARLVRYDDESLVHDDWIRQRYQGGFAQTYAPARKEAVATAWHEAGHAVAALSVGARFSSASIRAGGRLRIRELARGLLVWPRHLPYAVAAELAGFGGPPARRPAATGPSRGS